MNTAIARAGEWLFRNRGWIPAPFAAVLLLGRGDVTVSGCVAGAGAMAAGEALRVWGVAAAGPQTRRRTRGVARLVTHGPFAHVRNPIYLGNLLMWLGFVIAAGATWFVPIAAALFAVEYGLIVRFEEHVLGATFGLAYDQYREQTPRWVPRRPGSAVLGALAWRDAMRRESLTVALVLALCLALAQRRAIG